MQRLCVAFSQAKPFSLGGLTMELLIKKKPETTAPAQGQGLKKGNKIRNVDRGQMPVVSGNSQSQGLMKGRVGLVKWLAVDIAALGPAHIIS